jgi:predicted amidophosphoribosyltransferase
MRCSECAAGIPNREWICPNCGDPAVARTAETGEAISKRGMVVLLLFFVVLPVLLFLIQIFGPGM